MFERTFGMYGKTSFNVYLKKSAFSLASLHTVTSNAWSAWTAGYLKQHKEHILISKQECIIHWYLSLVIATSLFFCYFHAILKYIVSLEILKTSECLCTWPVSCVLMDHFSDCILDTSRDLRQDVSHFSLQLQHIYPIMLSII